MESIAVDLGSGSTPRNPFNANILYSVDVQILDTPNHRRSRLGIDPLPFHDGEVDYFTAYDLIEHIPRVLWRDGELINPFIYLLSEIFRCLKHGGVFYSETPAYPHSTAFQDPTHVNIISESTVMYFCIDKTHTDPTNHSQLLKICHGYGFNGAFELVDQQWRGAHLLWKLLKP